MTTIADQNILVTGANRGVGREFVAQLLERGAATVYAGVRGPDSIDAPDPRVVPIALDVTDPTAVSSAAARVVDVDVVVNNAGISQPTSVLDPDTRNLRQELEVNLFGPLAVTAAFLDSVVARRGAVVNIASVLSWIALGASYSVSKAALWSATDSMREELRPNSVQVLGVYMGYVDTDMTAAVTAPKIAAADVVRQALDALEAGADEVLADETARLVRASLSRPIAEQIAQLTSAAAAAS